MVLARINLFGTNVTLQLNAASSTTSETYDLFSKLYTADYTDTP